MSHELLAAAVAVATATSFPPGTQTYANPIDIDYRYNWEQANEGISYRTGADPAIVNHKGRYYLFETLADGYWVSDDLARWTFITPSKWPTNGVVAPAVWSDGQRLYMLPAAFRPTAIFVSERPETGQLDYLTRRMPELPNALAEGQDEKKFPGKIPPGPWDPALFKDDDGRWYLYWNSSNVYPIYGIELDPAKRLAYVGQPKAMFGLRPDFHGWERFGQDHSGTLPNGTPIMPYVEGAWMSKIGGHYYLQYGAPGTEYNAYANGTYVGDKPLGPFAYAPWNPIAYKPGGFMQGAGHGSTFSDRFGNLWNSGTPWIGDNWTFERRIDLLPGRSWADGQIGFSARFGDFPHYTPNRRIDDPEKLFTGWMLLSYRKHVVASSTMGAFSPDRVTDENPRSFWVAAANRRGETLTIDLGKRELIRAIQVDFADYKSGRFADAPDVYTEFSLEASDDGSSWRPIARTEPPRRDRPNAYFQLPQPVSARFVRYVHGHVGAANLAISEVRVFGNAGGAAPSTPKLAKAIRDKDDRNANIHWSPVRAATGYNILWGVRPGRLTLCYQKFGDQLADPAHPELDLRALNHGVPYYVAIEAFNDSGVSRRSRVLRIDRRP